MKQKKKQARLAARQGTYDKMNIQDRRGYRRPGSTKRT